MALSKSLKRKVDSENRAYKEEWKDNYTVILPSFVNAKKLLCLIFNEAIHRLFWMSFRTFQIKSPQFISKHCFKTFSYIYFEGKFKTKWLWVIVKVTWHTFKYGDPLSTRVNSCSAFTHPSAHTQHWTHTCSSRVTLKIQERPITSE